MTANAGYHLYNTGDVLTAAQVQFNLQNQTVMYFATASARTTALSGVTVEGMVTYIPANGLEYYNGSAWLTLSTGGDITDVLAGKGLTGGGTSGSVTLALGTTAKGDLVAGTGTTTAAALTVGADGTTLVADSSTSTGLRYQGSMAAGKNAIINGGFDVWQRGTSFTPTTSINYCADRCFTFRNTNSSGTTLTQTTGTNTTYALKVQRTAGNTFTDQLTILQNFESINSKPYAGKTVTFSFYAKAGANYSATSGALVFNLITGTGTDQTGNPGFWTGGALSITGTATLTTTLQRFSFTGTLPSNTNQISTYFYQSFTGTAGADDSFTIEGVQLELGSVATSFARSGGTIQGELAACQRYYVRNTAGDSYSHFAYGIANATNQAYLDFRLLVQFRALPTLIDFANVALYDTVTIISTSLSLTLLNTQLGTQVATINAAGITGLTQYRPYYLIANNNTAGYLGFSAEL